MYGKGNDARNGVALTSSLMMLRLVQHLDMFMVRVSCFDELIIAASKTF